MKELVLKVRRMSEENLKNFDKGQWHRAFEVSDNNFKTWWSVNPKVPIGALINRIKYDRGEL